MSNFEHVTQASRIYLRHNVELKNVTRQMQDPQQPRDRNGQFGKAAGQSQRNELGIFNQLQTAAVEPGSERYEHQTHDASQIGERVRQRNQGVGGRSVFGQQVVPFQ